jgi:uncharacterized heparinase superfamily protein
MGRWVHPACRTASLIGPAHFRFLSVEYALDAGGWDDPRMTKLWRYNLHYFDDLNAVDAAARTGNQRALVRRWVSENPPAAGTGWEPYPVSLRIVNWIKWALSGSALEPASLHSLAVQARWLRQRLEFHLLGNHLFANAKALVHAGLFFSGDEAEGWLDEGLRILEQQISEQILADCGHFERSPMYHALALEDILDLINLVAAYGLSAGPRANVLVEGLRGRVPGMQRWLLSMTHPDGSLAQFNDTAEDVAPTGEELARLAIDLGLKPPAPLAEGLVHLHESGYVRAQRGAAVVLMDVAPIGPDYLPGHAHADTLSFELSIGRQRVVINGGTSRYGSDQERVRERSTASHSTVEFDGQNSSEIWAAFRVGRRAYPFDLEVDASGSTWAVACSHSGYSHLPGRPVHRRRWELSATELVVGDSMTTGSSPAFARYILAPEVSAQEISSNSWLLHVGPRAVASVEIECGAASLGSARCAQRFGITTNTLCLTVSLVDGQALTRWLWQNDAHSVPH